MDSNNTESVTKIKSKQQSKNFKIAWFGTFMAGMAFSEAMPFLALYIMHISHLSQNEVSFYSGISYAVSYLVVIVVSPVWGKIADNHGRKPMLLRTAGGMGLVIILLSCVNNIWQIIVLRLFQGFFDGYTPSVIALISAETPISERATIISKLSTGYIIGGLMGPLVGGTLASIFNIRITFLITGVILLIVALVSFYGIKEDFQKKDVHSNFNQFLNKKETVWGGGILLLLGAIMIAQFVESLITPYISLIVKNMISSDRYLIISTGIVSALPGIATALCAHFIGEFSDRIGIIKIIKIAEVVAIVIYLGLGMTTNLIIFSLLRFLLGVTNSGITPMLQVLLSKSSDRLSTVFSMSLSAQSLGSLFGSVLGAILTQFLRLNNLFFIASISLMFSLIILKKRKFDN